MEIIKIALDLFGDDLRDKARETNVRDKWLQNVATYLDAVDLQVQDDLTVPMPDSEGTLDYDQVLTEMEGIMLSQKAVDHDQMLAEKGGSLPPVGLEVEEEQSADVQQEQMEDEEDEVFDNHNGELLLYPRSYKFFYKRLLRSARLWKRPPHNHCSRCAEYTQHVARIQELQGSLLCDADSPEYKKHMELVKRAGGSQRAWQDVRNMQDKLPDLRKHVDWFHTARKYLKKMREAMPETTAELQLDYGGFNDSKNDKVSVWSVTVISSPKTGRKQEHFDFFFDQAASKTDKSAKKAKKDGLTGIFMLGELLDPAKGPRGDGVSLFKHHYPDVTDLVLSGDTGNGYRAYAMLQELSTVKGRYDYRVWLIPLAPGHAWNRTDARIAHMNTFLNVVLAKSRVFGAAGVAAAFRAASDDRLRKTRTYLARSHIFFVEVTVDRVKAKADKKQLSCLLTSDHLDHGKMGVRGFLYFDFSVKNSDNQVSFVPGYARVREHADPDRVDNPTYVWTWRKDLSAKICQQCSDNLGGPVLLTVHDCTKKKCTFQAQVEEQEGEAERARILPSLPLQRLAPVPVDAEVPEANKKSKPAPKKKKTPYIVTKPDPRQVRVVHGKGACGKMEIWLYVPESIANKSDHKRKGWWLHEQEDKPRHYYIGPIQSIQSAKTVKITDVAVFENFPFTRSVTMNGDGQEISGTVRCVTDRPLTEDELVLAKDGEEVEEPHFEAQDDEDEHIGSGDNSDSSEEGSNDEDDGETRLH